MKRTEGDLKALMEQAIAIAVETVDGAPDAPLLSEQLQPIATRFNLDVDDIACELVNESHFETFGYSLPGYKGLLRPHGTPHTASGPRKILWYQLMIMYPVLNDDGTVRHTSPARLEFDADPLGLSCCDALLVYLESCNVSVFKSACYEPIKLDYWKIEDVEINGIDYRDSPDFVDAFIASATYDGREMTDDELDALNEDSSYVHEKVYEHLY